MYVAGVDIGSTMTKVVIHSKGIVASVIGRSGAEHRRLANKVMEEALRQASLSFDDITYVVATGYGRINVPFADSQITEIECHAKGAASLFPSVRTLIDIGGQDCKGIEVVDGKVVDFFINDKCAAGTGRFLELVAETLGLKLEEIGELSLHAQNRVVISSTCSIFAQQEVVSRLSEGVPVEDVLAGIHEAIAGRIAALVQKLMFPRRIIEKDVVITGGGAKNVALVKALGEKLGEQVLVPAESLLTGAIGAALLGEELAREAIEKGLPGGRRRLEETTFFT